MKKLIFTTGLLLLPLISSQAWSDCVDTGTVSSITVGCTSQIDLTIPELVIVKNLGDINLGTYSPGVNESGSDDFCIGSNSVDGSGITVTFTSTNPTGATNQEFNLAGTTVTTNLIPYTLEFNGVAVDSGVGNSTTSFETLSCLTDSSNIQVDVLASDIDAAADVAYQDTILVTVAPN